MTNIPFGRCHEIFHRRICQLYFEGRYKGPDAAECALCHKFSECEKMVHEALSYVGLFPEGARGHKAA